MNCFGRQRNIDSSNKKNQFSKKADLTIQSTMTDMLNARYKVKQLIFKVCMGLFNLSWHEPVGFIKKL